jgi:hypothetical protein
MERKEKSDEEAKKKPRKGDEEKASLCSRRQRILTVEKWRGFKSSIFVSLK